MTTPVNLRDQDKERLLELFFDDFQVAGVHMKSQAILSMYSYSATCGIVGKMWLNMVG
jgi:actin-related protein